MEIKRELEEVKQDLTETQKKLTAANAEIAQLRKLIERLSINDAPEKGAICSRRGKAYEYHVWDIVTRCSYGVNGPYICWQDEKELGGSSSKADLILLDPDLVEIPIELKTKFSAPDWVQCSLKYIDGKWVANPKSRQPQYVKDAFDGILEKLGGKLFAGSIPPFCTKQMYYNDWVKVKGSTSDFNDHYIDCDENTISGLYMAKSCKYIQVGDRGLYRLSEDDPCGFEVPLFRCPQRIRIRIKVHSKKTKSGYCSLSIMAACQPCGEIISSPYTLDDLDRLPKCLKMD